MQFFKSDTFFDSFYSWGLNFLKKMKKKIAMIYAILKMSEIFLTVSIAGG